mmetsp:Transcript_6002/g.12834  ORF Transcript_6002/g.12834 Transcript_6002/m.12834 type:complete len:219 (-) Transcript_6002:392-1048(-)
MFLLGSGKAPRPKQMEAEVERGRKALVAWEEAEGSAEEQMEEGKAEEVEEVEEKEAEEEAMILDVAAVGMAEAVINVAEEEEEYVQGAWRTREEAIPAEEKMEEAPLMKLWDDCLAEPEVECCELEEEQEEEEDSNVAAFGSGESDWLLARLPEGVGRKGMLQHLEVAEERMPFADCAVARIEMQWLADEAAAGEMEEGGRQWFPVAFRHGAAAGLVE